MYTELESLQSTYWDLYKDVTGVRPRHISMQLWEDAEWLKTTIAALEVELEVQMAEERVQEAQAVIRFEKLIAETIEAGAYDRETAIRWIADGEGVDGDMDELAWRMGLPYRFFRLTASRSGARL